MIVVCDPIMTPHKKHLSHFIEWYAFNKAKHDLELWLEVGRPLQKVQANAVDMALKHKATHVLFTEHDQWGYPVDALGALLRADKDVIGMQTYQRGYPFLPMNMRLVDPSKGFLGTEKNLKPFYATQPVEQTDLITWGFTLVKTEVFQLMYDADKWPWIWDRHPTDSHFCQVCMDMGIDRWVCSEGWVGHGEMGLKHIPIWRRAAESVRQFDKQAIEPADEDHDVVHQTEYQKVMAA